MTVALDSKRFLFGFGGVECGLGSLGGHDAVREVREPGVGPGDLVGGLGAKEAKTVALGLGSGWLLLLLLFLSSL